MAIAEVMAMVQDPVVAEAEVMVTAMITVQEVTDQDHICTDIRPIPATDEAEETEIAAIETAATEMAETEMEETEMAETETAVIETVGRTCNTAFLQEDMHLHILVIMIATATEGCMTTTETLAIDIWTASVATEVEITEIAETAEMAGITVIESVDPETEMGSLQVKLS